MSKLDDLLENWIAPDVLEREGDVLKGYIKDIFLNVISEIKAHDYYNKDDVTHALTEVRIKIKKL